jgi:hypothetical protein
MKTYILTATFFFFSFVAKSAIKLTLTEAVNKKLVSVNMRGAEQDSTFKGEYSSHYGPCMALEVVSLSADDLNLALDYGYKLEPADTTVQTMMVTQSLLVNLAPKQKKNYRIYAMCTEASQSGPNPKMAFKLGHRTYGHLLEMVELLHRKKYQGNAAQDAVWCLTDNHDISSIYSMDTAMMFDLRKQVAKAKGMLMSKVYEMEKPSGSGRSAPTFRTTTTYSGSFTYNVSRSCKILIALFDEENHMKKVYVNNENQREGKYTYNYQISSDDTQNQKHYLRVFRDGKMEDEISILPR